MIRKGCMEEVALSKMVRDRQGLQWGKALQVEGKEWTKAQMQRGRVCKRKSQSFGQGREQAEVVMTIKSN